jgi:hypothetical protein
MVKDLHDNKEVKCYKYMVLLSLWLAHSAVCSDRWRKPKLN